MQRISSRMLSPAALGLVAFALLLHEQSFTFLFTLASYLFHYAWATVDDETSTTMPDFDSYQNVYRSLRAIADMGHWQIYIVPRIVGIQTLDVSNHCIFLFHRRASPKAGQWQLWVATWTIRRPFKILISQQCDSGKLAAALPPLEEVSKPVVDAIDFLNHCLGLWWRWKMIINNIYHMIIREKKLLLIIIILLIILLDVVVCCNPFHHQNTQQLLCVLFISLFPFIIVVWWLLLAQNGEEEYDGS